MPVAVVARKDTNKEWKTLLVEGVKAKSDHDARRKVVLDFIEKGYQVKKSWVEYA